MSVENEIISIIKNQSIDYVLTLPCAKIKKLIELAQKNFTHISLSREEEGIGISTGIHLAGKKSVLMIQSGGIGNSLNALLSLAKIYRIPIPILISWRGIYKEKIEAQKPMGEYLPAILQAADLPFVAIKETQDIPKINEAIRQCFDQSRPWGILLSPKIFEQDRATKRKREDSEFDSNNDFRKKTRILDKQKTFEIQKPIMTRFQAIEYLANYLKEKIVISNIGIPSKELYQVQDQATNFYMLGSFGLASSIGLGIALNSEQEVVVLDGDASILTNPNTLGTICQQEEKCENLTVICLDNGVCGSTGNQRTLAYNRLDLEILAKAYGFRYSRKTHTPEELMKACDTLPFGPRFIHVILQPGNEDVPVIPLTAKQIKQRFQETIKK
ncbi:MAG: sulfopyruvate decarboxylase subunit beta [Candidatus Heimdallarchaeota archaeon]|nr:sulfopyruvate decarboxylase subunit beta [Candidatus Heimdallarchaeota archaeon]